MKTDSPPPNGRLSPQDAARLDALYARLVRERSVFIGYPVSAAFDYTPLYRFLEFPSNNVGDPFIPSNYHLNTHEFEREVLAEFFDLTAAPADDAWGYITSGGTEGNLYGIFLGRELLPDGMVYYSEDTHYSVNKILRALHVRNIMIRSREDGRIDLDDLYETLRIHRDVPPILFLNIGTTMKGAIDDLEGVNEILRDLAIGRRYIHADAALHGMILPFVDRPQPWNFEAGIDSISISGHKFIGAPFPCGVVIARKGNVERIARSIEYVGSLDTTLSGSRNSLAALFLWYALRTTPRGEFRRIVAECLDVADYAIDRLEALGRNPWRHEHSPIVVFDRPPGSIMKKWQIAVQGRIGHVIAMPHVTREQVDRLVADLAAVEPEEVRPR
ncbi:MAG: histidine decarboxylase [Isosphaeraceae bacterium]|nr:MAG: histidine decarboxylase [Isosphaeraceae bacterium]